MKKLFTFLIIYSSLSVHLFAQGGIGISGSSHLIITANTYLRSNGALTLSANRGLIIRPDAFVTINGNTRLNGARAMVIEANIDGVGSFLDNGTVSSSSSGSAEVQTWVYGQGGPSGVVYMHLVGPTVTDIDYYGTATTGVRLQQFNMTTLDTYAYEWDASVDTTTTQPWVNVWPFGYNVIVANGLALTNYVAGTGIMHMVGTPVTGNISYLSQNVANNQMEVISNPYPSAINFDAFASTTGANSGDIQNKYWIYTGFGNSAGNWTQRANGVGGSQYLQVGQGFFVQTLNTTSAINFSNTYRAHSNDPFREIKPNVLSVNVRGGNNNYKDAMYIYFEEGATFSYDEEIESKKWNSLNDDATMIRSIANDDTELAINALPLDKLNTEMITVPTHFQCGYEGDYTMDFNDIETFEENTEIWLEDLQTEEWYSITSISNQYTFNATPEDSKHRFNIHFFGPTGVPETGINPEELPIKIYSSKQFAYILNNSNEIIKDVVIYDLMGQILYSGNLPHLTLNKVFVSNTTGYYVVRVLTNNHIYIEKVFITH
ncbi:MAG: hypothetical protein DRJ15_08930 [Bacteroidetes bacterium]|nr:MAG: hypothetical protein DRJ15_08930 [Bacteroidota bacterium]